MPCWSELQGLGGGSERESEVEALQDLTHGVTVKGWGWAWDSLGGLHSPVSLLACSYVSLVDVLVGNWEACNSNAAFST